MRRASLRVALGGTLLGLAAALMAAEPPPPPTGPTQVLQHLRDLQARLETLRAEHSRLLAELTSPAPPPPEPSAPADSSDAAALKTGIAATWQFQQDLGQHNQRLSQQLQQARAALRATETELQTLVARQQELLSLLEAYYRATPVQDGE